MEKQNANKMCHEYNYTLSQGYVTYTKVINF